MRPSCRCVVPMHIALCRVSRDALTFGRTGILLTEVGQGGRLTTTLAGTLRASLQRGRTWPGPCGGPAVGARSTWGWVSGVSDVRIGVDWGGTKIEAIALSDAGTVLARKRIATPQHDYAACVAAVARLVTEIEPTLGQAGTVAIGIPGGISPATGLVKN